MANKRKIVRIALGDLEQIQQALKAGLGCARSVDAARDDSKLLEGTLESVDNFISEVNDPDATDSGWPDLHAVKSIEEVEADGGWHDIIGERKLIEGVFADYGMGEACIGYMVFQTGEGKDAQFSFEVGRGESLRPYIKLYDGESQSDAAAAFFNAVTEEVQ